MRKDNFTPAAAPRRPYVSPAISTITMSPWWLQAASQYPDVYIVDDDSEDDFGDEAL